MLACPLCSAEFKVENGDRGAVVRCPGCGAEVATPAPDAYSAPPGDGPIVLEYSTDPPDFTIGGAFSDGWRLLCNNYWTYVGASAAFAGIYVVFYLALFALPLLDPPEVVVLGAFLGYAVLVLAVVAPTFAGLLFLAVLAYRGQAVTVAGMFAGFKRYGSLLGLHLCLMLIVCACYVPAIVGGAGGVAMSSGPRLGIPAVILMIGGVAVTMILILGFMVRFFLATYVCLDMGFGPIESLRASWRISSSIAWRLLGLFVLDYLILYATALMCGVGAIFLGMPLVICTIGVAYCQARAQANREGRLNAT